MSHNRWMTDGTSGLDWQPVKFVEHEPQFPVLGGRRRDQPESRFPIGWRRFRQMRRLEPFCRRPHEIGDLRDLRNVG